MRGVVEYRCSSTEDGDLDRPVQGGEIKKTLFSISSNKASEQDGYLIEFYKEVWPVVGRDFLVAVQFFFPIWPAPKEYKCDIVISGPQNIGC